MDEGQGDEKENSWPEHPANLTSLRIAVSLYLHQGRWKEVEELGVEGKESSRPRATRYLGPNEGTRSQMCPSGGRKPKNCKWSSFDLTMTS